MKGVKIDGGVEIMNLKVRALSDDERVEQKLQLIRSYAVRGWLRLPVWPARPHIGPYGVRWESLR